MFNGDPVSTSRRFRWWALGLAVVCALTLGWWLWPKGVGSVASGPLTTTSSTGSLATSSAPAPSTTATLPTTSSSTTAAPTLSPSSSPKSSTLTPSAPTGEPTPQPAYPSVPGVEVVITGHQLNADRTAIEVIALVLGSTREGVTCTAASTNGAQTVNGSSTAVFDGRGLSCGMIRVPLPAGATGEWSTRVAVPIGTSTVRSAVVTDRL